ncbi:hypothetical protein REPUB_Repub08aG0130600 [Reevesia pubescens]
MEEAIVLYPSPVLTHQIAMVELGKLLLTHQPSLSIHILIVTLPFQAESTAQFFSTVSATIPPSITFHKLPTVTLHPSTTRQDSLIFDVLRLNIPNVRHALLTISINCRINAIILDFFCSVAFIGRQSRSPNLLDFKLVASDLDLPTYCFYTSGAGSLASLLYLPILHRKFTENFKDLNLLVDIPGVPPIPSSDMPTPLLKRNDKIYEIFFDISGCLPQSAGIIINTFESIEPRTIKTIADGLCMPDCPTPPIYCIGPFIANNGAADGAGLAVPECLKWLDSQPSKSVVFLSFGSLGLFSMQQLREIAVGLERSGQRFLWVVRNPSPENQSLAIDEKIDPDLNSLLPEGFLERIKERGHVVKSWAPQVAVLNHDSVGGFVTHCGWNSVLESVCAGVPMVAWPLYAEQRFNKVLLVEEMKIALPMVESETGLVSSTEVEKRVKELMEFKEGNSVRERTIAMKHAAKAAVSEGGSSRVALTKLFESWKQK